MIHLLMRPRHPLAREIIVVLAVKMLALTALYFAFFGPAHRPDITPEKVDRVILGVLSPSETDRSALLAVSCPAEPRRNVHYV